MKDSFRKFLSNKNTVTIIGIILCVIILFIGYYYRISQKVALTRVPYANQEIKPKTKITANMINYMNVPASFLVGSYYNTQEDIVGKYSQYNTKIIEGSLFYKDLLTTSNLLPNSAFLNVKKNETVVNYKVNMDTTYANSMQPDDVINIYFKWTSNWWIIGRFSSKCKWTMVVIIWTRIWIRESICIKLKYIKHNICIFNKNKYRKYNRNGTCNIHLQKNLVNKKEVT